jgi:hypothetical protein
MAAARKLLTCGVNNRLNRVGERYQSMTFRRQGETARTRLIEQHRPQCGFQIPYSASNGRMVDAESLCRDAGPLCTGNFKEVAKVVPVHLSSPLVFL